MKEVRFATTLYTYDRTVQVIDPTQNTTIVFSGCHPRKGTVVNTALFIESLAAYVEHRDAMVSMCKSISTVADPDWVNVDAVLMIYHDIYSHDLETAVTKILDLINC